ncbi:MAG: metal ABC transporter ATP-binding protein [Rikenellaceae bacterium]|nr:metal ABC transporter ATP-binding protein [Rikenellaceae bacterium]
MSSRESIITLRDVGVRYDGVVALEHVNIDIYNDDFIGIIGPNGGGKSSLVKAITGVIGHSGTITYNPSIMRGHKPHIGYLPQISTFDKVFPISVLEVVMSGLQAEQGLLGRYGRKEREQALELLDRANLKHLYSRPIGELSGGQLQRVMLCRAIISRPKVLVLDEPTNFVDNRFENELYNLLHHLADDMAIIMVSHDIGTVSSVVKSIMCVNRHVHRHESNIITEEQLRNYDCPIQIISHGHIPHTVLGEHHECPHCKE